MYSDWTVVVVIQVFYVDFGNTETLPTTSLRADSIYANTPAQAYNCVLDGIRWVWSSSVCDQLFLKVQRLLPRVCKCGVCSGVVTVWHKNNRLYQRRGFGWRFILFHQIKAGQWYNNLPTCWTKRQQGQEVTVLLAILNPFATRLSRPKDPETMAWYMTCRAHGL